jgi:hypothetical protein
VKRRLLLDSEVVDYLDRLIVSERSRIWMRLLEIAGTPDRFIDYHERDARGRDLAVHVSHGHAILYWDDFADRHVKIMEITNADDFPA